MSSHGDVLVTPARHRPARRRTRAGLAVLGAAALVGAGLSAASWWSSPSADAATIAASPLGVAGRGAQVPFIEQEAERAATNGTVLAPDRKYGVLATEASGRRAVTLDAAGEYVEFTLTAPANAMTFRYSIPDDAAGTGRSADIDVRADGVTTAVPVTSRFAFFYGAFPFTNVPGSGGHHFYDEGRTMFGRTLAAGATVRLQLPSTAQTPSITIDLADFELVGAPVAKPGNALDVVADYGADPTGANDATAKFQAAVDAGREQNRPVYVPQGTFTLYGHVIVDKVTLQGAGPWYTVLGGRDPRDRTRAAGLFGRYAGGGGSPSTNVTIRDLAIIGDITERDDSAPTNALGGSLSDSVVDNVWLQHTKVGLWLDGPADNFTLRNSRILDQTADGVNFHRGITNSTVENTFVRNTGDDGLAMWSQTNVNAGNTFAHNTVVAPMLANAIAIYGGKNMTVTDNVVADTIVSGGGVHVANRFDGVSGASAVSGTFTLARNTLIRAGSPNEWASGVGALWFDALNAPLSGAEIKVSDTDIVDSSYAAVQTVEGSAVRGLDLRTVRIVGAGTYALLFQTAGAATLTGVTATGIAQSPAVYRCGTDFAVTSGTGNAGWSSDATTCPAQWPAPLWTATGFDLPATPTTAPAGTTPTVPATTASTVAPASSQTTAPAVNVARGRPATASSRLSGFAATTVTDGDAASYWEGAAKAWPATVTVDLGSATRVGRIVLRLPDVPDWNRRVQTLSISGSPDGKTYTTLLAPTRKTFDASTGNTVTVKVPAGTPRYLRVSITANTAWPAGQLSELEAYAS